MMLNPARVTILVSIFLVLGFYLLRFPSPVLAVCNPPNDYTDCNLPPSPYGGNLAGNISEENFKALRDAANQNPSNIGKTIQATIILTKETIGNHEMLLGVLNSAKKYGLDLTIRIWTQEGVTPSEASQAGQQLAAALLEANMLKVKVEFGNEPNFPEEGYASAEEYGASLAAFASACGGCNIYLPALGGPPGSEPQKYNFALSLLNYLKQNDPAVLSQITGIMFNTAGSTPLAALTDWTKTLEVWRDAANASGVNLNFSNLTFFLTEVGPPGSDKDWPHLQEFLTEIARLFAEIKAGGGVCEAIDCSLFDNMTGLTFFIWDGENTYLVFVDEKGNVTIRKMPRLGGNLGGSGGVRGTNQLQRIVPIKPFPEESEEDCPPFSEQILGNPSAVATYHKKDSSSEPEMSEPGGSIFGLIQLPGSGLNFGSAVRGTHCGQTRSDPVALQEVVPFDLFDPQKCKSVDWAGELAISPDDAKNFVIPFAKEIEDSWAGRSIEHYQRPEFASLLTFDVTKIWDTSGRIINQGLFDQWTNLKELVFGKYGSAMPPYAGALEKLSSGLYQDQLKCSFVNYVKVKGSISNYANFQVDGKRLVDIPCPPTAFGNYDKVENDNWDRSWRSAWSKIGLFPDERSTGKLRFQVCADKEYDLLIAYPNVFRLGLTTNELYKIYTAKEKRDDYYVANRDITNLKRPLDKNLSLMEYPSSGPSRIADAYDSLKDRVAGVVSNARGSLENVSIASKVISKIKEFFGSFKEPVLAQGGACSFLEGGIDIIPGDPFRYSIFVRKTALGQEKFPGAIGDVRIQYGSETLLTARALFDEIRYYSDNPDVNFPQFSSVQELCSQNQLMFRADGLGGQDETCSAPELNVLPCTGLNAPTPGPPGPQACRETPSCNAPDCQICKLAEKNPSDVNVWPGGYDKNRIIIGDPAVNFSFIIPEWQPGEPLPGGCALAACNPGDTICLAQASYCDPNSGRCGEIVCEEVHERAIDVYNQVPFLASIWNQAASATSGFINVFKPGGITGRGQRSELTGCAADTELVIDPQGNFSTNPAYAQVSYGFRQISGNRVEVSMTKPGDGQKNKITFYRLGGICNANKWLGEELLHPFQGP